MLSDKNVQVIFIVIIEPCDFPMTANLIRKDKGTFSTNVSHLNINQHKKTSTYINMLYKHFPNFSLYWNMMLHWASQSHLLKKTEAWKKDHFKVPRGHSISRSSGTIKTAVPLSKCPICLFWKYPQLLLDWPPQSHMPGHICIHPLVLSSGHHSY